MGDFYDTLKDVAQVAFTPEEMRQGEHIFFVESRIGSLTSPMQTAPAIQAILALKSSPAQLDSLVRAFSKALKKISGDDRSFGQMAFYFSQTITQLVKFCAEQEVARDELLTAYRDYLIRHHSGNRCSDNAKQVTVSYLEFFNQTLRLENHPSQKTIAPILREELKPTKIEGGPKYDLYWQTPAAKNLLKGLKELRFGPMEKQLALQAEKKATPVLTDAERDTLEWKQRLSDFLREWRDWKVSDEASEADYFHQKCLVFGRVGCIDPAQPDKREPTA